MGTLITMPSPPSIVMHGDVPLADDLENEKTLVLELYRVSMMKTIVEPFSLHKPVELENPTKASKI